MIDVLARIPDLDLVKIRRYCEGRIPPRVAHLVRLELDIAGGAVGC